MYFSLDGGTLMWQQLLSWEISSQSMCLGLLNIYCNEEHPFYSLPSVTHFDTENN